MLKKIYRLPAKSFKKIYSRGKGKKGQFLYIKTLISQRQHSCFAVTVSTKVDKKATSRNLLRRQIYSFLSQNFDKIEKGDYIITVLKKAEFSDLQKDLRNLFNV